MSEMILKRLEGTLNAKLVNAGPPGILNHEVDTKKISNKHLSI